MGIREEVAKIRERQKERKRWKWKWHRGYTSFRKEDAIREAKVLASQGFDVAVIQDPSDAWKIGDQTKEFNIKKREAKEKPKITVVLSKQPTTYQIQVPHISSRTPRITPKTPRLRR